MKKQLSLAAAVLLTAGVIFMSGCKKDDTTPPVVTLTGAATMQVTLNGTFTDPGATATDDKDGKVNVTVTGTVDVNNAAAYTLTYSATDAAGNTGTATRVVTVANSSAALAGNYHVTDVVTSTIPGNAGTYNYDVAVTASTTLNNKINISDFAGLNVNVTATVSGSTLTIASQNPSGMQNPGAISGNGTISGNNMASYTYTILYTAGGSDNGNTTSMTKF